MWRSCRCLRRGLQPCAIATVAWCDGALCGCRGTTHALVIYHRTLRGGRTRVNACVHQVVRGARCLPPGPWSGLSEGAPTSPCVSAHRSDAGPCTVPVGEDGAELRTAGRRLPKVLAAVMTSAVKKGSCTAGSPSARTLGPGVRPLGAVRQSSAVFRADVSMCGRYMRAVGSHPRRTAHTPVNRRARVGDWPVRRSPQGARGRRLLRSGPVSAVRSPHRHREHHGPRSARRTAWVPRPRNAFHKFTRWWHVRLIRGLHPWFRAAAPC